MRRNHNNFNLFYIDYYIYYILDVDKIRYISIFHLFFLWQLFSIISCLHQREAKDILMKEFFDECMNQDSSSSSSSSFKIVYCVGSRWNNVHLGVKTKDQYVPPPLPCGFEGLSQCNITELGKVMYYVAFYLFLYLFYSVLLFLTPSVSWNYVYSIIYLPLINKLIWLTDDTSTWIMFIIIVIH